MWQDAQEQQDAEQQEQAEFEAQTYPEEFASHLFDMMVRVSRARQEELK
jgi:hypothetical protein